MEFQKASPKISTLNEKPLHEALRRWYAQSDDVFFGDTRRLEIYTFRLLAALPFSGFFDPVHMTSSQPFYFAAELEIAADFTVIQHPEAIDDGGGLADRFNDVVGSKVHVMTVANRKNYCIHIIE